MMSVKLVSSQEAEQAECEHCHRTEPGFADGWTQIGRSRRRLLAEGENPSVLAMWCPQDEFKWKHYDNPTVDEPVALRKTLTEKQDNDG